jgi:hypothetical protein
MATKIPQAPRRRRPIQKISKRQQARLTQPALDTALTVLLARPRLLQVSAALIGIVLLFIALRPLLWEQVPAAAPATEQLRPAARIVPTRQAETDEQAALNIVALYNQASIDAGISGRPDGMAPFLAQDGRAWAEVQAEYTRRALRNETHDPTLTRWGVLAIAVHGDTATVETQEQWDDISSVHGQVLASKRGILTRNQYKLRRAAGAYGWLITDVTTTTIID